MEVEITTIPRLRAGKEGRRVSEKKLNIELEDICGQNKFLVFKWEDIHELGGEARESVDYLVRAVKDLRAKQKRNTDNSYWVVNQDEPYANITKACIFGIQPDHGQIVRALVKIKTLRKAADNARTVSKKNHDSMSEMSATQDIEYLDEILLAYEAMMKLIEPSPPRCG